MITDFSRPISTPSRELRVTRPLGEGGFGIVYHVTDSRAQQEYALKMATLWKQMPQDRGQVREKFKLEYEILKKLSDLDAKNIVKVFDYGEYGEAAHEKNPFMVLELCESGTLEERIAQGVDAREMPRIISEVLHGLHQSHEQGIIHRDLKPENILFDKQGVAKITDYGIAADVKNRRTRRNWMGLVNEVFATVVYSPPEQTNQRRAFHVYETNDIFAFGVILYEMMTKGQYPFGSQEDFAQDMGVTYQKRKEQGKWNRKQLMRHAPDKKWVDIVEQCLQPNPKDRFQQAGEILAKLGEIPMPARKATTPKAGKWGLRVMSGDENGRLYNLSNLLEFQNKRLLTLGWFDSQRPFINDVGIVERYTTYISARHATLEVEKKGNDIEQWFIRDGQFYEKDGQAGFHPSTNGVLVNSRRIGAHAEALQDGDIITVGDTTLKVELLD